MRADYNIYYYQLLAKQRGSPMWIPGPDLNLPTEYWREGIRIGNVGILYCSEGFGFLFNIFLPVDHPINEGRAPPGFEPLDLSKLRHELKQQVVLGPKSTLQAHQWQYQTTWIHCMSQYSMPRKMLMCKDGPYLSHMVD